MTLRSENPRIEILAHELAERTGEGLETTVVTALEDRLRRTTPRDEAEAVLRELEAMRLEWAAIPIVDHRSEDEILGYDENGLPN